MNEITAWQTGVDWARAGLPLGRLLTMAHRRLTSTLTDGALCARFELGGDVWAYWVRRGWDDYQAERSGC